MTRKAIALFSGGLDSILAAKVVQHQGVDVLAVTFTSPFFGGAGIDNPGGAEAAESAARYGIPHRVVPLGDEFIRLLKNPEHGYGSAVNPCIDCKAYLLSLARAMMPEEGADFVITGEVLGQRPMSQRLDALRLIARTSGLERLLLRPLSAKYLPVTLPEEQGWIDRERLPAIKGRTRKPQMDLAAELGIDSFPSPAGGCFLTELSFAPKVRDLFRHDTGNDPRSFHLLRLGRHFRISPEAKLIVGRNSTDNDMIRAARLPGDSILFWPDGKGPLGLLQGEASEGVISVSGRIILRYTKAPQGAVCRIVCESDGKHSEMQIPNDLREEQLEQIRL